MLGYGISELLGDASQDKTTKKDLCITEVLPLTDRPSWDSGQLTQLPLR